MQASSYRSVGDRERSGAVVRPDQRVFLRWRAEEDTAVDPLGLDELELPLQMGSDEDEHRSPLGSVVLADIWRKRRAVGGTAADHAVQPVDSDEFVLERVARIRPADVRADRAVQAFGVVIVVQELV